MRRKTHANDSSVCVNDVCVCVSRAYNENVYSFTLRNRIRSQYKISKKRHKIGWNQIYSSPFRHKKICQSVSICVCVCVLRFEKKEDIFCFNKCLLFVSNVKNWLHFVCSIWTGPILKESHLRNHLCELMHARLPKL